MRWRLVCCCTWKHKKGAISNASCPILVHASRLFTHRTGAGSCAHRAASRHRTSAARRSSRPHRSGCGCITDRSGPYASPDDGNLGKPGSRPHRRFRCPEHSPARVHQSSLVGQRAGVFTCLAQWPRPLLHILTRRILARSFQCLTAPEPRLRHAYRRRITPGTPSHHAIATAAAALPKIRSLRGQRSRRRGLRCCHTSSAHRAFCSGP
jgi:hypothetical protein